MSTKQNSKNGSRKALSAGEIILLSVTIIFLLTALSIAGWYGVTYLPVNHTSQIRSGELEVQTGNQHCTLEIPSGTLSIKRTSRGAVGAKYKFDAEVTLEKPLRFVNCEGGIPNWSVNLEAQATLVGADVKPSSTIRQPAFDRNHFSFNWTFVPEETVSQYTLHFWLRTVITQQDQSVENWNILVRDFPMENNALFGQTAAFWLIVGGAALVVGLLFLILFMQKTRKIKTSHN